MTKLFAIDPGPERSAYCALFDGQIVEHDWIDNESMVLKLRNGFNAFHYVLESPQAQDRAFGKLFRDTVIWAGRFIEAIECRGWPLREVDERDVRTWIVGSRTATNAALYQALKDYFGDTSDQPCGQCTDGQVPGKRAGTFKKCGACKGERFRRVPGTITKLNEHERSAVAAALYVWQKSAEERRSASA